MKTTTEGTELFRTKLVLEDGSTVYESSNGETLVHRVECRETVEQIHRRLLGFGDMAYSPELQVVRPAWSFADGIPHLRVMAVQYESASEPLDEAAAKPGPRHLAMETRTALL
jgi:hypothetical protein